MVNRAPSIILFTVFVLSVLWSRAVFADSEGFYIGPQLSKPFFITSGTMRGLRSSILSPTVGYQFKNDSPFRAHFGLYEGACGESLTVYGNLNCSGMPDSATFEYTLLTLGVDYVFNNKETTSWFVGAHFGRGAVEINVFTPYISGYEYLEGENNSNKIFRGNAFGFQFGSIFKLSESVELETGFRSTWTTIRGGALKTVFNKVDPDASGPQKKEIIYDPSMEQLLYPYLKLIYIF